MKKSKWFRKDNFIILILAGILLFVIALPIEREQETKTGESTEGKSKDNILTLSEIEGEGGTKIQTYAEGNTDEEYARYLEERLKEVLERMADVGEVEVMITLQSSRELVVEKEQPITRSSTEETDSQGGSRVVNEMDSQENTVYRSDGTVSEPYVIKTLTPEIEGVLVVAQGAGSGTVSLTIVEIVQALFGVEAHKVKVVKMNVAK